MTTHEARAEPINADLEELLAADPDSRTVLTAYADWLELRAEPRARLIRLQLQAEDDRLESEKTAQDFGGSRLITYRSEADRAANALVEDQWSNWFGELPIESVYLEWAHGFVRKLVLCSTAAVLSDVRPLLSLPVMRFLRSFRATVKDLPATLEGIELPQHLEELHWELCRSGALAPLGKLTLPSLAGLKLDLKTSPTAADLAGLLSVKVPQLRWLQVNFENTEEAETMPVLLQVPWLGALDALEVTFRTGEGAHALLQSCPKARRLGTGLTIRMPAQALTKQRTALRRELPEAWLVPIPKLSGGGRQYTGGGPTSHPVPVHAPKNYRDLPPWGSQFATRDGVATVGSGVPLGQIEPDHFSLCTACGSEDTRCIFYKFTSIASFDETTSFRNCEYECLECGRYTSYEMMS